MPDWKRAFGAHHIARKLKFSFDPIKLVAALDKIKEEWWVPHRGPYHDGGWESVSLWAPGGNLFEQRSFGGTYAKTVATLVSPYFWEVTEQFSCEKSRVRLLRLRSGSHIFRHSDPIHEISSNLVRLHIPVSTNPNVRFIVNDQHVTMLPGEVWHIDVRFPHEVHNLGSAHRVHLVLDLLRNPVVDSLLHKAYSVGSGRLTGYFLKHSLPKPLIKYFRIGN